MTPLVPTRYREVAGRSVQGGSLIRAGGVPPYFDSRTLAWDLTPAPDLQTLVTLPLLLLGLYLGLLVAAISLASWAGHMSPAPDEARRVTDAVERAGLSHLFVPARLALAASLIFTALCGTYAALQDRPLAWFIGAPLLAPPLVGAALFYGARKLLKASGQLVGAASADGRMSLMNRTAMGAVLCCDATVGLVLLGLHSLAARELGPEGVRFLVFLVGSSIALAALVFARATASAHYSVSQAAEGNEGGLHAGSLALLVSSTFHAPLLRLISLVLVSVLGHCALLSIGADEAGATAESGERAATLWLYPHLLRLLGLFALLFAGMVARTSDHESGGLGWLRGVIVYLVLMVAGAWSLSSELPVGWARTVPAGLTFLYVALGLSIWAGGSEGEGPIGDSVARHALRRLPGSAVFLGLVTVLLLATVVTTQKPALPHAALLSLIISGTLAAVPLSVVWLLARDLSVGSSQANELAFVGVRRSAPPDAPSVRLLSVLPHLCLVVALATLSSVFSSDGPTSHLQALLVGLGLTAGALVLAALMGHIEKASSKTIAGISNLVRSPSPGDSASLNFESAVVLARDAIAQGDIYWLLLALAPAGICLVALPYIPPDLFRAMTLGLALGAISVGVLLELLQNSDRSGARRTLANLSFIACLAQALWLLTAGGSLT